MPLPANASSHNASYAYLDENMGAFTVAGPHHVDGSQDTFWPASLGVGLPIPGLNRLDVVQNGRLYLLSDGVSLCADGKEASQLAVEAVAHAYYRTTESYPDTDQGRQQRLEDAIWQGHRALLGWDQRFFCWRSERHDDGVMHHFKKAQLSSITPPLCPLCGGHLVGLQATLLAVLARGNQITIVGVGDSSAFRIPNRSEFGVEWLHTPTDEQFMGMPSLNRQAIVGHTHTLSGRDNVILCSDGVVKVLNALHQDMGWHNFLRDQLDTTHLQVQVTNLVRDLDAWRQTRKRDRKLQDDLSILSLLAKDEAAIQSLVDNALADYDNLQAHQRSAGVLPSTEFENFIISAESALAHNDSPQLWQLYSNGLYGYALAKLNESVTFDDVAVRELLISASRLTRRTEEWVKAYSKLTRLSRWINGGENPAAMSSSIHSEVVGDLYGVDLRDETPNIVPRVVDMLLAVASMLDRSNRRDDAGQYRSFANYLNTTQPRTARRSMLPTRDDAASSSTEAENTQALEMQIQQAIARQDWQLAQELIIELNKLKGANALNLDTESVDTRYARPRWEPMQANGAVALKSPDFSPPASTTATPVYDPPTNPPMQNPLTPNLSGSQFINPINPVGTLPSNQNPPTLPPAPPTQIGSMSDFNFMSRNPIDLMRDAARLAFSSDKAERNLTKAYELSREASKLHPDLVMSRSDWQTLWTNTHHDFDLVERHETDAEVWDLGDLTIGLQIVRDVHSILSQSQTYKLDNLRSQQARNDNRLLEKWRSGLQKEMFPYDLGQGALWQANQLCVARLRMPPLKDIGRNDRPYARARRLYSEAIWHAILAQGSGNKPSETYSLNTHALIDDVITMQEAPWTEAARQLQSALQHESLIVRAFYLYQLRPPENSSQAEQTRLTELQHHMANAAWEYVFAMAEQLRSIDRMMLQSAQSHLVNADFDVTRLSGPLGLRLSIIYNLLSLLIHDPDGPIVNGYYAYEIKVPRQLAEQDFRRLNGMRQSYIGRAWQTMLTEARDLEPFYLPPSSRFIGRIKPDGTTPEGRRLQAIRAYLPNLTRTYDDWIEYAALVYEWQPPLPLAPPDALQLNLLRSDVAGQAWDYILRGIRGLERPDLTTGRIHQMKARLSELNLKENNQTAQRLRTIIKLMPLLLELKAHNSGLVKKAMAAQLALNEIGSDLNEEDSAELKAACSVPMNALWDWCMSITANPFSSQATAVRKELEALPKSMNSLNRDSTVWQAIGYLLNSSAQRLDDPRKAKWEPSVKQVFKAFRVINVASNQNETYLEKDQQLHDLSYRYLAQWKDSLPNRPAFFQRRRVNAEKRRIQNYWMLRKEYRDE